MKASIDREKQSNSPLLLPRGLAARVASLRACCASRAAERHVGQSPAATHSSRAMTVRAFALLRNLENIRGWNRY
jgi:hypothetical protein